MSQDARRPTTSPRILVQAAQLQAADAEGRVHAGDNEGARVAIGAALTTAICAVAMSIAERTSHEVQREAQP